MSPLFYVNKFDRFLVLCYNLFVIKTISKGQKMEEIIKAVLEWRKAKRAHAKLGANNYFHHSDASEKLFKDSCKQIRLLGEKMNQLLDEYEGATK